jgi:signal transduction histidine kinase
VVYLDTAGKPKSVGPFESRIPDANLYHRGQFVTALARWTSVGFCLVALGLLWNDPKTKPIPAGVVVILYLVYSAADALFRRRHPERLHAAKVVHDVVDALAVGAGAAFSGGLESPIWLLLYPHAAAVSVRGGLRYAMVLGLLDATIVLVLNRFTLNPLPGNLHAPALLFCAFMGGTTRSYLKEVKRRLGEANEELQRKNAALEETMKRLADLDRLRLEYVRNVSHEFRTPLTVIRLAGKKAIALDLQFPREPLTIQGDQELLQHVVRKLVDNALKYSRPGSRAIVRGRGDEGAVALEVQDFGIGIAPEHLPLIFEKFYMVDGALTRRSGGAGVGLYLAREVVRLHHGAIEVQSRIGEGTVFSVRLPRRFPEGRPLAAPA